MKIILFLLVSILLISSVYALDECESIETASQNCEVVTPVIECSTYDLYNSSHALDTDDGLMTQIGATGVYYFTFNEATEGDWIILLCSNHTAVITVETLSIWDKLDAVNTSLFNRIVIVDNNLISINSTLYNEVDAVEENLTWISSMTANQTYWFQTINSSLGTVSVNNTAIAKAVWDYNLTAGGYSTNNTGVAGSIMRYIALTVYWVERLLPR